MDIIFHGKVKTRKSHHCWGCMKPIPIGSTVKKTTTVDSGEISSAWWCDICDAFFGTLSMYDQMDGFTYGELRDYEGYPKAEVVHA